jgi:hypothetical protein
MQDINEDCHLCSLEGIQDYAVRALNLFRICSRSLKTMQDMHQPERYACYAGAWKLCSKCRFL